VSSSKHAKRRSLNQIVDARWERPEDVGLEPESSARERREWRRARARQQQQELDDDEISAGHEGRRGGH
jgi:hypothetical protein